MKPQRLTLEQIEMRNFLLILARLDQIAKRKERASVEDVSQKHLGEVE